MNSININLTDEQFEILNVLANSINMTIEEYVLTVLFGKIEMFKKLDEETSSAEKFIEAGFNAYSNREYLKMIEFFDKARELGYDGPGMYYYYAVGCRKLKQYQKELDILNEAILKCEASEKKTYKTRAKEFIKRKERVIELLNQNQ